MGYLSTSEMVRNTELEILADALDQNPEELEGYIDDEAQVDDLEQIEGWDGRPLPDEEILETAINGWPDSGNDRPMKLQEDQNYESVIGQLQHHVGTLAAQNQELMQRLDPDRQWRADQQKAAEIEAFYTSPEGYLDARDAREAALANRVQELEGSRVNASLAAAHRERGRDFEEAYRGMTSMNPAHPAARALVKAIWDSPDPGAALMEFYDKTDGQPVPRAVGGQYSRGSNPPSLNSQSGGGYRSGRSAQRGASRGSGDWPFSEDNSDIGGFSAADEREVYGSIWR